MESFLLDIHVRANARADRVDGRHDGVLAIRVSAPPTAGRANAAACRVVAEAFGLRPRQVDLVAGARSRRKTLRLEMSPAQGAAHVARLSGPERNPHDPGGVSRP
jgi:uncharacterized protein